MAEEVKTQSPGNIWKVLVKPGDTVKAGDVLFILEVMKMEFPHEAPRDGTVTAVYVTEGQENVDGDIVAVEIGLGSTRIHHVAGVGCPRRRLRL